MKLSTDGPTARCSDAFCDSMVTTLWLGSLRAFQLALQMAGLEGQLVSLNAAAQAAAETAAADIAAVSTACMRAEARCAELQAVHFEV